jgi:hypothetical protein
MTAPVLENPASSRFPFPILAEERRLGVDCFGPFAYRERILPSNAIAIAPIVNPFCAASMIAQLR